jgi:hypothetical protein
MKRPFFAGDALNNQTRILIDENAQRSMLLNEFKGLQLTLVFGSLYLDLST